MPRSRQLRWLAAALVPAGLLSATTTYITTDLASAPFLWIWPLAIYLLSFVVAFSTAGRRLLSRLERLVPAAATLLWVPWLVFGSWPILPLLLVVLSSYAVLACVIHGRLAEDRPDATHITRFYLVLSAGGVLATAFVSIVAPLVFPDVFEYPILIVAGLAVLASFQRESPDSRTWPSAYRLRPVLTAAAWRLAPYLLLGAVFVVLVLGLGSQAMTVVGLLAAGAVVIALAPSPRWFAGLSAVAIVGLATVVSTATLFQERTFFGVLRISNADGGASRAEYSGTTLHGVQFLDARRTTPTSYYVRSGPLGDVFDDLDTRLPGASIGVVGLGAGTIAAYERPTDHMTFFEIDPAVARLAEDPHWFTYLADAPVPPQIVLGDGRLALEATPPGTFDVLVLDAFSSDNVPAHLLTREAMEAYRRALKQGGLIVFHISNRSYDLARGISSTALSIGLAARQLAYQPGPARIRDESADGSNWVIVGTLDDTTRFAPRGWSTPPPGPVLTDDFSDLVRMLTMFE